MEALNRRSYDVIVSDISMPDIDGHTFIRTIRSGEHGRIPAIALSAYARGEDVERSRKAGYQEHLTKPLDSQGLVEAVKRLGADRYAGLVA